MKLATVLLIWYEGCKRDLPWRKDKDPYKIWVSEIMLQQTRVETVKPYFERWITRFPDLQSLAMAEEEEVIQYWQGLGYYSRARNLLRGVREVNASYGGQIPDTKEKVAGLSGIGDLIVTCASVHSRNRKAGMLIGQGMTMDEAMKEVNMVVEGIYAAKAANSLAKKYNVELPIIQKVNEILFNNADPREAVNDLMLRDKTGEIQWP